MSESLSVMKIMLWSADECTLTVCIGQGSSQNNLLD
jgi:hypothetical protein